MSKDVKEVRMSGRRVYRTKGIASPEAQRRVAGRGQGESNRRCHVIMGARMDVL